MLYTDNLFWLEAHHHQIVMHPLREIRIRELARLVTIGDFPEPTVLIVLLDEKIALHGIAFTPVRISADRYRTFGIRLDMFDLSGSSRTEKNELVPIPRKPDRDEVWIALAINHGNTGYGWFIHK